VSEVKAEGTREGTWQQVLADNPPHTEWQVRVGVSDGNYIRMPELTMYCDRCEANLQFKCVSSVYIPDERLSEQWADYVCKNCEQRAKRFAMLLAGRSELTLDVEKIGESPAYGPNIPPRVVTLIRDERDLFFKGRRAEAQGLGIGAFVYYRRVVVAQRNRLLEAIIDAATNAKVPAEKIEALTRAKEETRFTESMELAQGALPEVLFISGNNPLKVLHDALSEGLHAHSDEQCLERAEIIRMVLTELADRLHEVTKDRKALTAAINKLRSRDQTGPSAGG
jgi:hypothetical protein